MNIILLSGGSGTRLWPLSNEVRSKQFLKIFDIGNDNKESMIQRMFRMIKQVDKSANITVATSENQVPQVKTQLNDSVNICVEPCRRDTFPAIVLACAYLVYQGTSADDSVVVCPVDPYVDCAYFECLKKLDNLAKNGEHNLNLMGIRPTYPSEKYGYIFLENNKVSGFKEKPTADLGKEYISHGALWNGGVFSFKISYILDIAFKLFGFCDYKNVLEHYNNLEKISFDYAVAEKEEDIGVIVYDGEWKDLGTWNTITEAMSLQFTGNVVADKCDNTHIINELGIPLVALGLNDIVVAATADGILVSDKEQSSYLKDYVKPNRPMYERREWGEYRVLEYVKNSDKCSLTKHLVINAGKNLSYQMHRMRTEMWTIIEGEGTLLLDDVYSDLQRGDTVIIEPGVKHSIKANTNNLHIIEVQLGKELSEEDIERF